MSDPTLQRQLPVADGRAVAARLWTMLRGRRLTLAGILVLFVIEAATVLVFPLVIGSLVDTVLDADTTAIPSSFWWQVAALIGAAVVSGVVTWVAAVGLARLAETVIAELREEYVGAALSLPRQVIEAAGTGDVVTRAGDDIGEISGTVPQMLPRLCGSVFTLVLVAGGLGALDLRYLAGFAVIVPLYVLTVRWYLRTAPEVYAAERSAQSVRGQEILGTVTQLPTVAAHRLEQRQLDRIRAAAWYTVRWAMRTRIVQNRLFGRLNIAEALGLFAVLGIGVWLALDGQAGPGQVTAAALLYLRTVTPIAELLFITDDAQSAAAALGRVIGILEPTPDTDATGDRTETQPEAGSITLTGVEFAYRPGVPVLHDLSVQIRAGEVLAVVGATGSGKSTLAALIAGVYPPTAGRVDRAVAVSSIAMVTQETHVFTGTLRDNLTLAAPDADDAALVAAMERIGLPESLDELPDGLDTRVGDGGRALTPEQAQLVALARIMLTDPAVVILDEATADTDTADTQLLDRAAAEVIAGRTALVIAHRLSQARAADRILVLDQGRAIELGTHDELLAASGAYAQLWRANSIAS